jgi:hypothetical protein
MENNDEDDTDDDEIQNFLSGPEMIALANPRGRGILVGSS